MVLCQDVLPAPIASILGSDELPKLNDRYLCQQGLYQCISVESLAERSAFFGALMIITVLVSLDITHSPEPVAATHSLASKL